jgi:site-specific DNA recombinase
MRCVLYLRVSTREQAAKGEGEEGFSIPAQREAAIRHLRDAGHELIDEYADRGESARSADRPALKAMLTRIAEDRDIEAVVVHKIDRLARNMEDHVAIRALFRKRGVALISVTENVEETASGRLVEGIHALMAEFYSANLANEIRKGMTQKAKQGGFPHAAPLGYLNTRDTLSGRQVARIIPDPDRAPLIIQAFEHYATGNWTLQTLAAELAHRGLTNRGTRSKTPAAISWQGLGKILANPAYTGIIEWNGARHPGTHQPLVTPALFQQVQDLLGARSVRGCRERKHPHYLKGVLHCEVCGRRLSVQHSKGQYTYFYCLGQKADPAGTCREPYVAADRLETQIMALYDRIQPPASWLRILEQEMAAEVEVRQQRDLSQRRLLTRQLAAAENQRRKLLDAYYNSAIDVATLKTEQARIGRDVTAASNDLAALDVNQSEWQQILTLGGQIATKCATAYRKADEPTRRLFNTAVFENITIKDGQIATATHRAPFDQLLKGTRFEYENLVEVWGLEPQASSVRVRRSTRLSYTPRKACRTYHAAAYRRPVLTLVSWPWRRAALPWGRRSDQEARAVRERRDRAAPGGCTRLRRRSRRHRR